jgi:hypothetical protein
MDTFLNHKTAQWDERAVSLDRVTDTPLSVTLHYHKLDLSNVKTVLVVGVGRGSVIKSLVQEGKTVYGTDISNNLVKLALESGARDAIISIRMKKLPPVDLALCHLVLQHNVEPEVERLINDANLNPNGLGSYQYSTLANDTTLTSMMVKEFNEGELNVYSIERMKNIVNRTNKRWIKNTPSVKWRDEFYWDWNIVQFRNK